LEKHFAHLLQQIHLFFSFLQPKNLMHVLMVLGWLSTMPNSLANSAVQGTNVKHSCAATAGVAFGGESRLRFLIWHIKFTFGDKLQVATLS